MYSFQNLFLVFWRKKMEKHIITLCGPGCCPACPEIFVNESKDVAQQVRITDDFGHEIFMSKGQFNILTAKAKNGELEI